MPHLIYTLPAQNDLQRLRQFLANKNRRAANSASLAIRVALNSLRTSPEIGRPVSHLPGTRELVIPFSAGGYIARYRYLADRDTVFIVAIRHQREAKF